MIPTNSRDCRDRSHIDRPQNVAIGRGKEAWMAAVPVDPSEARGTLVEGAGFALAQTEQKETGATSSGAALDQGTLVQSPPYSAS